MIAEFFIVAESFATNSSLSKPELETKIKALSNDFDYIRKYKDTNRLYVHPDIYNVNFLTDITLSDLLFDSQTAKLHLDRDVYNSLQKIVIETEITNYTSKDVIEVLLPEHNEDSCHGLVAFNKVHGIASELQIVYDMQGWLNFRRHFLGLYPKNENFYVDECVKYFPNLFFHERNKKTITTIFHDCPIKIIYHLSALNDKFYSFDKTNMNRTQVLTAFSAIAHLDETASLEGNASKKKYFTFGFENDANQTEDVCCEPHLKLCYSDTSTSYSNGRRIYFHEGVENIKGGRILIGHIGEHL